MFYILCYIFISCFFYILIINRNFINEVNIKEIIIMKSRIYYNMYERFLYRYIFKKMYFFMDIFNEYLLYIIFSKSE